MAGRKYADPTPRLRVRIDIRISAEDLARLQAARLPGESLPAAIRRLASLATPSQRHQDAS